LITGTLTDAVAQVRARQVSLTFDPAAQTLTAETPRGKDHYRLNASLAVRTPSSRPF
jgi:hypothetical protein